jgi:hypothetical protein
VSASQRKPASFQTSGIYLAPVLLEVDARIEELGKLDAGRLAYEVGLEADTPDFTRDMREDGLIRTITHLSTPITGNSAGIPVAFE